MPEGYFLINFSEFRYEYRLVQYLNELVVIQVQSKGHSDAVTVADVHTTWTNMWYGIVNQYEGAIHELVAKCCHPLERVVPLVAIVS